MEAKEEQHTCIQCLTCADNDTEYDSPEEDREDCYTMILCILLLMTMGAIILLTLILSIGLPISLTYYEDNNDPTGVIIVCSLAALCLPIISILICSVCGVWTQQYRLFATFWRQNCGQRSYVEA
jgi:hypothetical protein